MNDNAVLSPFRLEFDSQEEFEDYVMGIVMRRLAVYTYIESPTGGGFKDYICKEDLG